MRMNFLFFLLVLTSCGYHPGRTDISDKIKLSVPFVTGDFSGIFTNELITQISNNPTLSYKYSHSDYILSVKIIKNETKQIGYKYDRNNQNERLKMLRATEGRQILTAEVKVIEKKSNKVALGPFKVSSHSEFDYVDPDSLNDQSFIDPNGQRKTILSFSLGQLDSIESAKEAALIPLYAELSKKIVDSISTYW